MKKILRLCFLSLLISLYACGQNENKTVEPISKGLDNKSVEKQGCNWCGTSEAPENVTWSTVIPSKEEEGEKLVISGTIYLPDGKTPAKGIVVYVHHTNHEGIYPKRGDENGNGQYHGYLRGWMKTDSNGKYQFETIRPAAYHSHEGEPAHIHYNIEGANYPEYWLTALWFSDDPRVTKEYLLSVKRDGGYSNVISLTKDDNKTLRGTRNIILETFVK